MKITERRLRSIIRSVIKESQLNEMMGDMHHFDALSGAAAHGSDKNPLYQMIYPEDVFGSDSMVHPALTSSAELVGMSGTLVGMLIVYHNVYNNGSLESFAKGVSIAAGSALYVLIKNYLETGNLLGNPRIEGDKARDLMSAKAELEANRHQLEIAKNKLEKEQFDKQDK